MCKCPLFCVIMHVCGWQNPKVDHRWAVKEYSGAAADKEEPLPHELRPIRVLQMTMDYLLTQIMDAGEERTYDWYDFLWNRTRGIRKVSCCYRISLCWCTCSWLM